MSTAELLKCAREALRAGKVAECLRDSKKASAQANQSGDHRLACEAVCLSASALVADEKVSEAVLLLDENNESGLGRKSDICEAIMLHGEVSVKIGSRQADEALAQALKAREIIARFGRDEELLRVRIELAFSRALLESGSRIEAERVATDAIEACKMSGDNASLGEALQMRVLARLGEAGTESSEGDATESGPNAREALKDAYEALAIFQELKLRDLEATILNHIASARLVLGYAQSAVVAAKDALAIFRELDLRSGKCFALETMIKAYTSSLQAPLAVAIAKEELALARSAGDRKSQLAMLRALTDIYGLMGRTQAAIEVASEAANVSKELKEEEAVELLAVAELQLSIGRKTTAQQAVEKALRAAQSTGDHASEKLAKRLLSELLVDAGKSNEAPNRSEAVELLTELANAVDGRDAEAFQTAWARLNELSAFNEEDVQQALGPVLEKDLSGSAKFLRSVGFNSVSTGTGTNITEHSKEALYLNFRVTGLNYGPHFRNCRPNRIVKPGSNTLEACSVLQLTACDGDEKDWYDSDYMCNILQFNPGLLDSMQHTGTALGF